MAASGRSMFRIFRPTAAFAHLMNAAIQAMKQERETNIAREITGEAHGLLQPYGTQPPIPLRPKILALPAPTTVPAPAKCTTARRNDLSVPIWVALERVVREFSRIYTPQIFGNDADDVLFFGQRRIPHQHVRQVISCQSQGGKTVMSLERGVAVIIPLVQTGGARMSIMPKNGGEPIMINWTEGKLFLVPWAKTDLIVSGAGQSIFLWICWS